MFERPDSGERVLLLHQSSGGPVDEEELQEFRELVRASGGVVVDLVRASRARPDPRLFIGRGKGEEVKALVAELAIDLVIFNHELSPSQERNLEREFQCRVVDRTGLILDIFAQRAHSFEGKLQVELAQLRHLSTRLVRGWTHLERQKGGIGLRGPGETQLESDRRLLQERIATIRKRLERVDQQRDQGRRARRRAEIMTVSLVGYTNAGKSTIFNVLTHAGVFAEDQLFATLDPTLRRIELPDSPPAILADTVGFVSRLPHELVAAFRATLQETVSADLLLHVIDAASPRRLENIFHVEEVLQRIGAAEIPRIEVYNKIDLLTEEQPGVECDAQGQPCRVRLSAYSGEGVAELLAAIADYTRGEVVQKHLLLGPGEGRLRALLFAGGWVRSEAQQEQGGWSLEVELPRAEYQRLLKSEQGFASAEESG